MTKSEKSKHNKATLKFILSQYLWMALMVIGGGSLMFFHNMIEKRFNIIHMGLYALSQTLILLGIMFYSLRYLITSNPKARAMVDKNDLDNLDYKKIHRYLKGHDQ